jgi:hypothetical protein
VSATFSQNGSSAERNVPGGSYVGSSPGDRKAAVPPSPAGGMATKPEDPPPSGPPAVSGQEETNPPENTSGGTRPAGHAQRQSAWSPQSPYALGDAADKAQEPAFEFGWQSYLKYGRESAATPVKFEDVEPHLAREWRGTPQSQELPWEVAQGAARDAWDRVQDALTGETTSEEPRREER